MRIKVFPPPFADHSVLDERGWLNMEEGATVKDVLKKIKLPSLAAKILLIKLNGETPKNMNVVLHDEDIIGFFTFMTGG